MEAAGSHRVLYCNHPCSRMYFVRKEEWLLQVNSQQFLNSILKVLRFPSLHYVVIYHHVLPDSAACFAQLNLFRLGAV